MRNISCLTAFPKVFQRFKTTICMRWVMFFLLLPCFTLAQEKYTLSGYIRDSETGENLTGANMQVKALQKGTVSNNYGFYSLTLPKGSYTIIYSYLGYQKKVKRIKVDDDQRINVALKPKSITTDEVEIKGERPDANIENVEVGTQELDMEKVEELPALLGEVDVMKTMQLLPGVQASGEGTSGFNVRGGGVNQNLVLLDEAPVYNTGHLFGFFSVFNSDAINNTKLIKGGIPAKYGGRLSSVVDIGMKEGNNQEFSANGGIGLISSKLTAEGPIQKGKSSFMISGRRTYIDILTQPFAEGTEFEGNSYHFYDLNAKVNYKFSDKDRLFLSGYFGRDVFQFENSDESFGLDMPWGNTTGTLRWNHLFNDQLFMNVTAIYNDYNFEVGLGRDNWDFSLLSGIRDFNLKADFSYYPGNGHDIKFGVNHIYHTFIPNIASGESSEGVNISLDNSQRQFAHESAAYIQDEFDLTSDLKVNLGLRFSMFNQVGPYNYYEGEKLVESYDRGEHVADYYGLEPRLRARYKLNSVSSIKASYTRTNQYIHLVSNSGSTLPSDVWVPSTKKVEPQIGDQYSMGYFRNFADNSYETSLEIYYKDLQNQIEFDNGYTPELGRLLERDFVFGRGESFGAEVYVKKRKGDFTGWISYTLSKTTRFFEDLRTEVFPAPFDRRHDLSVVGSYKLNDKWSFSATFVYGTGQPVTIPERRYLVEGIVHNEYGPRNGFRLQDYHRLDLSAELTTGQGKDFQSSWVFSVYNVYNRLNPFFIYFDNQGSLLDGNLNIDPKKVALFPIIPSVRWKFNF